MLRVVFAGSPQCAVYALEAVAREHTIVAILTNPPSRQGRSGNLVPTEVETAARALMAQGCIPSDTPILSPEKIDDATRAAIAAQEPDVLSCFAYGHIFGPKTLALFPKGAINLHPSLLPRWRGCAPIPAAILAQDSCTGITIQRLARQMDSGDILEQKCIPLDGSEYADELLDRASREGAPLLVDVLHRLEAGTLTERPQNPQEATYSAMLCKDDGVIDWSQSAQAISARIRAFHPWPGAFTLVRGERLILRNAHVIDDASSPIKEQPAGFVIGIDKKEGILVQTGSGLLALETLQWSGKKALDYKAFANGTRDFPGTILGGTLPQSTDNTQGTHL